MGKSAQKNPPGKSPAKSSKTHTTKSQTHFCRRASQNNCSGTFRKPQPLLRSQDYCHTNGRRTAVQIGSVLVWVFPFLQGLEARKAQQYRQGLTAVQIGGISQSFFVDKSYGLVASIVHFSRALLFLHPFPSLGTLLSKAPSFWVLRTTVFGRGKAPCWGVRYWGELRRELPHRI